MDQNKRLVLFLLVTGLVWFGWFGVIQPRFFPLPKAPAPDAAELDEEEDAAVDDDREAAAAAPGVDDPEAARLAAPDNPQRTVTLGSLYPALGSATDTATGTTLAITVPSGGVAAGNLVVVRVNLSGATTTGWSCTDSAGNTYVLAFGPQAYGSSVLQAVFVAKLASALAASQLVTVTHPSSGKRAAAAEEFSGVEATVNASNSATGFTATPSVDVTPVAAETLVIGSLGTEGPIGDAFTQATGWLDLQRAGTTGNAAATNRVIAGGYVILSAAALQTYNPTITSRRWLDAGLALVATASGSDTTPPTTTLGSQTRTTISRVPGWDAFDVTITTDEPFVEYELRRVPASTSTRTEGSRIETAVVPATTSLVVTVTDDELVAALAAEGPNTVKAFTKDAAGNWST